MFRSNERGMALVVAMFMTLIVSALAASMTFVARTETLSSQSYTTMAQARYAAESGLAAAANYLLSSQYGDQAPDTPADSFGNYDTLMSPVRTGGQIVELSTEGGSNYPISTVVQQFTNAAKGSLTVSNGTVQYGARARLLGMRPVSNTITGTAQLLQTWEITGTGSRTGSGSAEVEVRAIIERQMVPMFRYGAFAADPGCAALTLSGGATSRSYNSSQLQNGNPVPADTGGDVGTNGNLNISGNPTKVYGTLSTPRTGVGSCTTSNVTAMTVQGKAEVYGGLVELPQEVPYPMPPAPDPMPPTTNVQINNSFSCSDPRCSRSGDVVTLSPASGVPYVLGNVSVNSMELVLGAGTYIVNSLDVAGTSTIRPAGNGPVIINVAGQGSGSTAISIAGGALSNETYIPANFQILYAGTKSVSISGGTQTSALVYTPKADVTLTGNSNFYGAVVGAQVDIPGSTSLYFDTALQAEFSAAGNPVMSSFTWRTF